MEWVLIITKRRKIVKVVCWCVDALIIMIWMTLIQSYWRSIKLNTHTRSIVAKEKKVTSTFLYIMEGNSQMLTETSGEQPKAIDVTPRRRRSLFQDWITIKQFLRTWMKVTKTVFAARVKTTLSSVLRTKIWTQQERDRNKIHRKW